MIRNKKFKLTKGRRRELELCEYFKPQLANFDTPANRVTAGVTVVKEDKEHGTPYVEAFFMKSERGKYPESVDDMTGLLELIFGHKRIALNYDMWREELVDPVGAHLTVLDFEEEPEFIQKLFRKCLNSVEYDEFLDIYLKVLERRRNGKY